MDGGPRQPRPKPVSEAEKAFLDLGPGAKSWLIEAAAAGTSRMRWKMAAAEMGDRGAGRVGCQSLALESDA
ncbi:hypothetical protein BIV24_12295 [Streptomyces colonosanans]|uniref:Uncharacterized protein n=1 Tax=Streptomyces colonosanans TaxID=1428652 RepID=A0A1S2PHU9_9ACTN|nr:hypothetical protein BIV24_12295 [Streptomyces colonosanans]